MSICWLPLLSGAKLAPNWSSSFPLIVTWPALTAGLSAAPVVVMATMLARGSAYFAVTGPFVMLFDAELTVYPAGVAAPSVTVMLATPLLFDVAEKTFVPAAEIGRASCRERVELSAGDVSLKNRKTGIGAVRQDGLR